MNRFSRRIRLALQRPAPPAAAEDPPQESSAEPDVESVRVLHCHEKPADRPAAAQVLGEVADGMADHEQQPGPDLSPFNAMIGDLADRVAAPLPDPADPELAISAPAKPAPSAAAPKASAGEGYGLLSAWDRCWARLTDEQRAPNSHECAHPGCTERLALAVRLCPDHRKDPRRA